MAYISKYLVEKASKPQIITYQSISNYYKDSTKVRLACLKFKLSKILSAANITKMAQITAQKVILNSHTIFVHDRKTESLESLFLRTSSEIISFFREVVSLLNQCISKESQGQLEPDKELKILGKDFKKQIKENSSLTLKQNCLKKKKKLKIHLMILEKMRFCLYKLEPGFWNYGLIHPLGPMGPNCNGTNVVHRPQTSRSWNVLKFYNFITFILFF